MRSKPTSHSDLTVKCAVCTQCKIAKFIGIGKWRCIYGGPFAGYEEVKPEPATEGK